MFAKWKLAIKEYNMHIDFKEYYLQFSNGNFIHINQRIFVLLYTNFNLAWLSHLSLELYIYVYVCICYHFANICQILYAFEFA